MTPETLEFLISQYLDGTLPPEELAVLEERLATDPAARALLAEYRSLDEVARDALPLPDVRWDLLADRISTAVAAAPVDAVADDAEAIQNLDEEFEFALSCHVDGGASPQESADIEQRLQSDPSARRAYDEYRSLNAVTEHAWALPEVKWDLLQQRLSAAVSSATIDRQPEAGSDDAPSVVLFSFKRLLQPARVAMAASLVIATSLAIFFYLDRAPNRPSTPGGTGTVQVAEITGPQIEQPAGAATLHIDIQPSRLAAGGQYDPYASEAVYAHGRVELRDTTPVKYEDAISPF